MKTNERSSATNFATDTTVLSISPLAEDHGALKKIFGHYSALQKSEKWKLLTSSSLEWATNLLQRERIPLALCEGQLKGRSWIDLIHETARMPHNPLVIVTSRLADERLWSEVLNLGGWDVLAKPFNETEVTRSIESAVRHWTEHRLEAQRGAPRLASGWA